MSRGFLYTYSCNVKFEIDTKLYWYCVKILLKCSNYIKHGIFVVNENICDNIIKYEQYLVECIKLVGRYL